MIIIGEKINSTLKAPRAAIEAYDGEFIQNLAKKQTEAGASFIDVNAGMFQQNEGERLIWLADTVRAVTDAPLTIDSPSAPAIDAVLSAYKGPQPMINSITAEKDRWEAILPLVVKYKTKIIALCMDDSGMPETAEQRFAVGQRLIGMLCGAGVAPGDIFIDPLVRPVATGSHYGVAAIETIRKIKQTYPDVHIACGLSNVSFGLPQRKLINHSFLIAAMAAGMDGAILDPLDKKLMRAIWATEALLGLDDFCVDYLEKFREGLLED
jgi:5-methyltetrahydrofolate--homocysteine methyltransferase